jgi:hypothetical protein
MIIGLVVLAGINTALLIWTLWVAAKIRDDQLVIRTWISKQLREKRGEVARPSLSEWLAEHPDRPYKHDPPGGPGPAR